LGWLWGWKGRGGRKEGRRKKQGKRVREVKVARQKHTDLPGLNVQGERRRE
jgi:hypothetical protein